MSVYCVSGQKGEKDIDFSSLSCGGCGLVDYKLPQCELEIRVQGGWNEK